MANNLVVSNVARDNAINTVAALLNGGTLEIYDGAQPASPDVAVTTQNKLATLTLSATAFASAANGSAPANAITSANAIATGTASWARWKGSGGTAVIDCTVGMSACDINLNTVAITSGLPVQVTSFSLTHPQ